LQAFRGELASVVEMVQSSKRSGEDVRWFASTGLLDWQCSVLVDEELRGFAGVAHDPSWPTLLQSTRDAEHRIDAMDSHHWRWTHPSKILTLIVMPSMHKFAARAMFTQMLVDQCVIACALERYRIEKGDYPETLDSVKRADGRPLPLDVASGGPMHYRKTPNGRYALWSVGFDGKDDGGKRTLNPKQPESTKFSDVNYVGDWVWDFPE
jgi:hypothetical protein